MEYVRISDCFKLIIDPSGRFAILSRLHGPRQNFICPFFYYYLYIYSAWTICKPQRGHIISISWAYVITTMENPRSLLYCLRLPIKGRVRSSSVQFFSKSLSVHIATRRRPSWKFTVIFGNSVRFIL